MKLFSCLFKPIAVTNAAKKPNQIKQAEQSKQENDSRFNKCCSVFKRIREKFTMGQVSLKTGNKIDSFSRIVFPVAFVLFNVIFYTYVRFIVPAE